MPSKEKIKVFSDWEKKFVRETPFMPFGSLMHAYSQINQGKNILIEQFVSDARILFEEAVLMTENTLLRSQTAIKDDEPEIPIIEQ